MNLNILIIKFLKRLTFRTKRLTLVDLLILDFDGVLTDNRVQVSDNGQESIVCWRSDGIGLTKLKLVGVKIFIMSTEENPVVTARSSKLQIECCQGVKDKGFEVMNICKKLNVNLKKVMFIGNDVNDIPALKIVGFPVCVADAYSDVYPYVSYVTNKKGGFGAVREVCDLIYESKIMTRKRGL